MYDLQQAVLAAQQAQGDAQQVQDQMDELVQASVLARDAQVQIALLSAQVADLQQQLNSAMAMVSIEEEEAVAGRPAWGHLRNTRASSSPSRVSSQQLAQMRAQLLQGGGLPGGGQGGMQQGGMQQGGMQLGGMQQGGMRHSSSGPGRLDYMQLQNVQNMQAQLGANPQSGPAKMQEVRGVAAVGVRARVCAFVKGGQRVGWAVQAQLGGPPAVKARQDAGGARVHAAA